MCAVSNYLVASAAEQKVREEKERKEKDAWRPMSFLFLLFFLFSSSSFLIL